MKTLIAIPCMDTMPTGFVQSLLYLEKGENVSVCFKANSLVYDSRNLLSLSAIEEGFDRVLWLDSDMMFTPKAMKMLMDDMDEFPDIDIVTGLYFKRRPPYTPVIFKDLREPARGEDGKLIGRVHEFVDYPRDMLFRVMGCGFGFCLMKTSVLKAVWDAYGPAFSPFPWAGEDLSFCHRANELGYTIFCDSRVSCGHIGTYVFTEREGGNQSERNGTTRDNG